MIVASLSSSTRIGFCIDAGVKLDLVECLEIGRVGHRYEQPAATPYQRQRVVLPNQPLLDQFLGDRIEIEGRQIDDRNAELFRRGRCDRTGVGEFVAN